MQDLWEERQSGPRAARPNDRRSEYEHDRGRLIHTSAFRRLQGKTQVLGLSEGDFHRTRLTHSMEVAQISRGIVIQLQGEPGLAGDIKQVLPPIELIEAVAFAHDLGHPPFGHSGEVALNFVMRDKGGFEANGQSLRLLTHLVPSHPQFGLDLTRRTLLGILKYPRPYSELRRATSPTLPQSSTHLKYVEWSPPKCYLDTEGAVVDWILEPFSIADRSKFVELSQQVEDTKNGKTAHKSLDCAIMELGDDIAYGVHDFEDGVALGLINESHWKQALLSLDQSWAKEVGLGDRDEMTKELFKLRKQGGNRKRTIGAIVHAMVSSVTIEQDETFADPLLRYRPSLKPLARQFLKALQSLVMQEVVRLQTVQTLEYRGRLMVMQIYDALLSSPDRLLPASDRRRLDDTGAEAARVVCDYVAGMTDVYATRMYERLFVPRQGTVFERL